MIPPIANGNGTGQWDLVVACKSVDSTGYDARITAAYDAKGILVAKNNNTKKWYTQLQFDIALRSISHMFYKAASKTVFNQLSKSRT